MYALLQNLHTYYSLRALSRKETKKTLPPFFPFNNVAAVHGVLADPHESGTAEFLPRRNICSLQIRNFIQTVLIAGYNR